MRTARRTIAWFAAITAGLSLTSFTPRARAEEYTTRSFLLPSGSFELTGEPARPRMANINLSENSAFEPVTLAPHFYWGVSESVTLGITHDRGICLNDGCWAPDGEDDHVYNDAGFGLLVGLGQGPTYEVDLHVEVPIVFFDPFWLGVRAGVLGRVNFGQTVAFVFDPSLYFGLTHRDDGNREGIGLPFWFYFQASDVVVPFVGSGLHAPLDDFGDQFRIPLEGGVVFTVAQNVDVGFVLAFPNIAGQNNTTDWREIGFVGRFRF